MTNDIIFYPSMVHLQNIDAMQCVWTKLKETRMNKKAHPHTHTSTALTSKRRSVLKQEKTTKKNMHTQQLSSFDTIKSTTANEHTHTHTQHVQCK